MAQLRGLASLGPMLKSVLLLTAHDVASCSCSRPEPEVDQEIYAHVQEITLNLQRSGLVATQGAEEVLGPDALSRPLCFWTREQKAW